VGRRGSGKTALAQYFSFQDTLPDPIYISADNPTVYREVLSKVAGESQFYRDVAVPRLARIWELTIWRLIAAELELIGGGSYQHGTRDSSFKIKRILNWIRSVLIEEVSDADEAISRLLDEDEVKQVKLDARRAAKDRPIITVLDTLEQYDLSDPNLINAVAALIQCAEDFNQDNAEYGIHVKVLMSGEIFPHLEESVLENPGKSIRDTVFLLWRPKDLLRLIAWRFHRYLSENDLLKPESKGRIDWNSYQNVLEKMWNPYFGAFVTNRRGIREASFPYVLRHTQMRPRQMIQLCNSIAHHATKAYEGRFPTMSERDITRGVESAEERLATEIMNSFSSIYPNIAGILEALQGIPMHFSGKELDKRAHHSAGEWPAGMYSQSAFRKLVAELGIVGRVKSKSEFAINAEFEYSVPRRLALVQSDDCVIHPLYYKKFDVQLNEPIRVIPFREAEQE
jgi:hypothetical protein